MTTKPLTLEDFKPGDLLVITERLKVGEFRRAAQVTAVNYNGNGRVTFEGRSDPELMETGQGAFDPAKVGTTHFGFYVKVEKVGHRAPWRPADTGWMYGHPGYDLMHDSRARGRE